MLPFILSEDTQLHLPTSFSATHSSIPLCSILASGMVST